MAQKVVVQSQIMSVPQYSLCNAYPQVLFSFIYKKVTGKGSSEVHCSKSIEKSEVFQKWSENIKNNIFLQVKT